MSRRSQPITSCCRHASIWVLESMLHCQLLYTPPDRDHDHLPNFKVAGIYSAAGCVLGMSSCCMISLMAAAGRRPSVRSAGLLGSTPTNTIVGKP